MYIFLVPHKCHMLSLSHSPYFIFHLIFDEEYKISISTYKNFH